MSNQQLTRQVTGASSSVGVGPMTATHTAERQYTTGLTRENIERALREAGKNPRALSPEDLVPLEDFHSLGRIATAQLIQLADVSAEDRVLDAGTGIGGTARLLAAETGCHVTAVDLTAEYCETADWLKPRSVSAPHIDVRRADLTDLPSPTARSTSSSASTSR
jgi:sarcosine/dimethylglycine N-methyltransferase